MKESEQAIAIRPWPIAVAPAEVAALLAAAAAALRLAILFRYRIDSDETQHMHVVWGWTHGLLPYRDLFDNHMPLFHILAVPRHRLAGERPEVLLLGRMAMLPLVGLIALLTWRLAASCHPMRPALPAVVIGLFAPDFFLCSSEFRPDVPWAACWLAALLILIGRPLTARRAAAAGLMLGLAAAISAKTSLLAAALAVAAVATVVVTGGRFAPLRKRAALFAAAALVPPSCIAAWFAMRGAWQPFLDCTVGHNLVATEHPYRILLLLPLLAVISLVTRHIVRDGEAPLDVRRRRLFLFLASSLYAAALLSLWPIIETEHWLPFYPAAAAAIVPMVWGRSGRPRLAIALLAFELFWILRVSTPWRNQVAETTAMIRQATRLTASGERVLDLKGELVFRRRAIRPVLEKITKKAIATGRQPDTIAADVLRTGTMVAVPDNASFPRAGRAFLQRNFVEVGPLRVAGMIVPASGTFRIEVPGRYALLSPHGVFHGTLDGSRYDGPRQLGAGLHTLSAPGRTAVVWARAAEMGLAPF